MVKVSIFYLEEEIHCDTFLMKEEEESQHQ